MLLNEEQSKLRALVTEAITVLCRNGITYKHEVCVEGLLGITTDNQDVFLISLNEIIKHEQLNSVQSDVECRTVHAVAQGAHPTGRSSAHPGGPLAHPGRHRTSQRKRSHPSASVSKDNTAHSTSDTPPLCISGVTSISTRTDEPPSKRAFSTDAPPLEEEDSEPSDTVNMEQKWAQDEDDKTKEQEEAADNSTTQVSACIG